MGLAPMITLKKRTLVFDHKLFDVFTDHIESSDGQTIPDFLVVAPKNRSEKFLTGVNILPVVDGKIGLLKIYRHPTQSLVWETPRGFVEKGEKEENAALRELEEETGLGCDYKHLKHIGYATPDSGILAARITLFVASKCFSKRKFEVNEIGHSDFKFFTISEIDQLIQDGQIEESISLVLYYYYRNFFK
ncbi:MAG: hypothetical protein A2W61_06590 [Deltaproteobacteria bacterium RIFCSPLOWO2_01_44_7]|nr:MAG: hypothetical protein A2712_01245 [Deltaproteobacteria bacterium RIFCSPHIGHO2_01_FULL_43_49]OGQ42144.1 MAG: hypothetical protein A2W61_06590 [Deltaproteobacteria bacterium RIFCSPLOWO2_01_44_7]